MSSLRLIVTFLIGLFFTPFAYCAPALNTGNDLRDALLLQWQQTVKSAPSTKSFEPTDDLDVFEIENTSLPYKGRVKISNVQIAPFTPRADFESNVTYGAVIDTDLLDPHADFTVTNPKEYEHWQKLGWLNYDSTDHEWFPFSDWPNHYKSLSHRSSDSQSLSSIMETASDQLLAGALVLVLLLLMRKQWRETQQHTKLLNEIISILKSK